MDISPINRNVLPLNAPSVCTFPLTPLKQRQKSQQFSAKPQVNILTSWLPVPCYSVTSSTKRSYRLVLMLLFAAVIPAWQQESHFVLQEERRHPLLSSEMADSQWVVCQLQ